MNRAAALLGAAILALASGCGGRGTGGDDDRDVPKGVGVGGAVRAAFLSNDALPGATVTLTDEDGDVRTATTSTTGLFEFTKVPEGVYVVDVSLAGYLSETFYIGIDANENQAFGDDDDLSSEESTPTYEFLGDIYLEETGATASLLPFGLEVPDGTNITDGVGGTTLTYDESADGDIVLTVSSPVVDNSWTVNAVDVATGSVANSTLDPTRTFFTITDAAINAMNGAQGPTENGLVRLQIQQVRTISPIAGYFQNYDATIRFRVVP